MVSTDPSTKPGQHWIAIYIDTNGVGEYFDSYGLPPLVPQFMTFLKKNCTHLSYSTRALQGDLSTVCRQYATFYLLHRCRGLRMGKIINVFSNDTEDNDILVNDFIRKHFPSVYTKVYDPQFTKRQISRALNDK